MRQVNKPAEKLLRDGNAEYSPQQLRDSDKRLLIAFWETEGLYLTAEQKHKFMNVTPAESITRARRDLKADYPASEKVDQERFEKFKSARQEYTPRPMRFF